MIGRLIWNQDRPDIAFGYRCAVWWPTLRRLFSMLDGESMDWRSPGISASSAFLCPEAPQSPHHLEVKGHPKGRKSSGGNRHGKFGKCFGQYRFQWLGKIFDGICSGADTGERGKLIDCPRIKMIVMQEVGQRQIHPAVLGKRSRPSHQSGYIAIGCADIVQYVLGSLLLQLDIAALRDRHEAVLDLAAHAARSVR